MKVLKHASTDTEHEPSEDTECAKRMREEEKMEALRAAQQEHPHHHKHHYRSNSGSPSSERASSFSQCNTQHHHHHSHTRKSPPPPSYSDFINGVGVTEHQVSILLCFSLKIAQRLDTVVLF